MVKILGTQEWVSVNQHERTPTYSWQVRLNEIDKDYFDKPHTQNDSMVRTKKWTMKNFIVVKK